jgi:hypothetical protein
MSSHAYLPNLSVHTAALGLGLSAASFFVFGNIGVTRMGLMQVNKPSQRARFGIRPEQALQFWEYTYDLGMCVPSLVSCGHRRSLNESRLQTPFRTDRGCGLAELSRGYLHDRAWPRAHFRHRCCGLLYARSCVDLRSRYALLHSCPHLHI